jgi:predicted nucleotidyltransferase component of viral defense system
MKKKPVKNTSASIRARLLNLARATGRDFQELTIRYAVERFLARLTESEHKERFILKGAMLYIPWKLDDKRTTMDLDLLGFGSPDMENLKTVFQQICDTNIEDDGLIFNRESITITQIREESVYDGVRVIVSMTLDSMAIRLQVDVGFGDQIVPKPQAIEFPALLAEYGPVIRSYSPETVIAEKFNAMIVLGMANSRMKDYFDIWMLSRNFTIEANILREAIRQTFDKRHTEFPQNEPIALSEEFFRNESKQSQWKGFIRKQRRLDSAPSLSEIIEDLRTFLLPVVSEIDTEVLSVETWSPEKGWSLKQ